MQVAQIEKLELVFGREQAYALADILDTTLKQELDIRELATKHDLRELETSLKKDIKELELTTKHEIAELRAATQKDIKELELTMKHEIGENRTTINHTVKEFEAQIKELELRLKIWLITAFILISAFFKALDFFVK